MAFKKLSQRWIQWRCALTVWASSDRLQWDTAAGFLPEVYAIAQVKCSSTEGGGGGGKKKPFQNSSASKEGIKNVTSRELFPQTWQKSLPDHRLVSLRFQTCICYAKLPEKPELKDLYDQKILHDFHLPKSLPAVGLVINTRTTFCHSCLHF